MSTGVQKAANAPDQKPFAALSLLYKTVLELMNTGASLPEVLEQLCRYMEKEFPGSLCSVLFLDPDGETLRHGAAPSLPVEYNRLIDGLKIGPTVGSCGTAAYRNEPVVVIDIASDPLWKDYAQHALAHQLRACWSTPILSRAGKVLGTFAVYYREPRGPDAQHLQMVECSTHVAGIAIERDEADRKIRAAETRYRTLVERLPAITYVAEVGLLGPWHYVSPQIQSILGFTADEWLADSANWMNHIHPEDREKAVAAETRFWSAGGIYHAEYRMIARDGRVLWFRDDATYLTTADAGKPLMQGVLYDITEHKHLEEQLRQSQKMEAVGKLAGGVAHDFNNLLMIIAGRNERLLHHLAATDPGYQDAHEIKGAVGRASALTRQLLAFSRKQVLQPRVLDMNLLVDEAVKMLHRLIGEDIQVDRITAPSLWPVKVDQGQMEQAILNLALNSRDAMPGGGTLTIETQKQQVDEKSAQRPDSLHPGRYVVLTVRDTGVGMNAETQSHIFEPFFSTKELGKGTGLGLASVYGTVEQSGGSISFESHLGKGTSFSIYLPATDAQPSVETHQPASDRPAAGTETILVVEDELGIRDLVTQYLRRAGYKVLDAANGVEALELAKQYQGVIHLLVTDVVMPQLGGRELARQLMQMRPETKVLFTSGYPEHATLNDQADQPGVALLQKPYPLSQLATRIREMFDRS